MRKIRGVSNYPGFSYKYRGIQFRNPRNLEISGNLGIRVDLLDYRNPRDIHGIHKDYRNPEEISRNPVKSKNILH